MMDYKHIKKKLKKALDKSRYEHTRGVTYTAGCLAMAHGADVNQAMLAGYLHDCAKCIPNEEKIALCEKNGIRIRKSEYENPYLLHAKLGAYLAKNEYGIDDEEILHAIKVHTTGEPDMGLLDKIIFIADYIEPHRDKATDLDVVRGLAFRDLDACMEKILGDTLRYLKEKGGSIDTKTRRAYEFYKELKQ